MNDYAWIFAAVSALILIVQTYLNYRKNRSEAPVDASLAAKNMSEVADMATARRLELERQQELELQKREELEHRIESLEERLNQSYYSVTVVFSIGDNPKVEQVIVKPVKIEKMVNGSVSP
jgi:hypothetical protein